MDEKKMKHLEFVQAIISRMAGNLFYLRGWVITLIAGALVLLAQGPTTTTDKERDVQVFLLVILVLFWGFDGYFLSLEKMYRELYDKVRGLPEAGVDFDMNVADFKKYKRNAVPYCMFSKTLLCFYVPLLLATLYVIFS